MVSNFFVLLTKDKRTDLDDVAERRLFICGKSSVYVTLKSSDVFPNVVRLVCQVPNIL